ncbi:hypothetical protein T265_08658 [Opisthorchis viverrini]|uniref:Uncharacterized protein n=1 Tax=Opisthorchis viverrini TaxID=6198 RepID=A0A074ZCT0_OPIVI|nr:hypothetical protein T265_08658 [Opisthorchis viverrini]KER23437.1 hypothetical protein T265_08658 [Opisthorchis viverrini]
MSIFMEAVECALMMYPRMVTKRLQANCQARRTDQQPPDKQPMNSPELPIFQQITKTLHSPTALWVRLLSRRLKVGASAILIEDYGPPLQICNARIEWLIDLRYPSSVEARDQITEVDGSERSQSAEDYNNQHIATHYYVPNKAVMMKSRLVMKRLQSNCPAQRTNQRPSTLAELPIFSSIEDCTYRTKYQLRIDNNSGEQNGKANCRVGI